MELQPNTATKVAMTAIFLHNYLQKSTSSRCVYYTVGMFDSESTQDGDGTPGFWRQHTCSFQLHNLPGVPRRTTASAQAISDEFAEYFVSPQGELSFQHDK
ncbi:hypothetical protein HHI36_001302 [Cryptolaemus montrouzieri]|uniref:Uncharacterized protein n=1 Tax=Cryptolaemus montrouzieri TaxID=559131 RepID=A0ABD2P7K5_9CUCU